MDAVIDQNRVRDLFRQREKLWHEILTERKRQEALKRAGKFQRTCADDMSNPERLSVLGEEIGEVLDAFDLARALGRVSRAVCEGVSDNDELGRTDLRKELIQVAAVCLSWLEGLDKYPPGGADPR